MCRCLLALFPVWRTPGSPLEFANHGGGARPVDPVDDEVRIQRIVTVQPGLQQADKIIAVARSQYNCHTSTLRRIPFSGKVIDLVTQRKGEMQIMESKGEMQHLEFEIPSRGLIGLRSNMLTNTAGEAVMAHRFTEYKPWKGQIPGRNNGVLLSKNQERTTGYSIDKLQDRGTFFVDPGEEVYVGQIIAEHIKPGDLVVNATEPKKLTNHRASGSDDASRIAPKTLMTLEECMEYIQFDECIEVTPNFIRMRKVILEEEERKRQQKRLQLEEV